jgi:hypothetical protein
MIGGTKYAEKTLRQLSIYMKKKETNKSKEHQNGGR